MTHTLTVPLRDTLTVPTLTGTEAERFWARVSRHSDSECWLWTGAVNHNGYGTFYIRKPTPGHRRAHRITWANQYGDIPHGFDLDHVVCRNTLCVNPAHLEVVTLNVNSWRRDGRYWLSEMKELLWGAKDATGDIDKDTFSTVAVQALLRLSSSRVTAACQSGELAAYKGAGVHRRTAHRQWYVPRNALYMFILNRAAEDAGATVARALIDQQKDAA
ncbi:HNH endonuclease signature motif containing protein [Mycobacteroides abscessus]|uniref:HNH endonuclease signature motif containing protein n=1 Tax=Mycobacteroides abscessus TaxID=36809 RepID=UPI0012FFF62B|nr:HNH endonuclease signature motif containing protein [Mycobacteroides abscessus]